MIRWLLEFVFGTFVLMMYITEAIDWLLDHVFVLLGNILSPLCHLSDEALLCLDAANKIRPISF